MGDKLVPFWRRTAPKKREEWEHPFLELKREMDSLFENFGRGVEIGPLGLGRLEKLTGFSPNVDIVSTDKDIKVTVELPGIDENDIEVTVSKDSLTIAGEKKEEKEDKGKDYYKMERSYGRFSRTIPIPEEVDTDKIAAKFKKGVLIVTMPKSPSAIKESKKVKIAAE